MLISDVTFYEPNKYTTFINNKFFTSLTHNANENIYWVLKLYIYEIRNRFKSSVQNNILLLFMHYLLIKDLLFIRWVWALSYAI